MNMLRYLLIGVLVVFAFSEPIKGASTNNGGPCMCITGQQGIVVQGQTCPPGSNVCLLMSAPPITSVCCTPFYQG